MGHELGLLHLNEESLKRVVGFKAGDMLKYVSFWSFVFHVLTSETSVRNFSELWCENFNGSPYFDFETI